MAIKVSQATLVYLVTGSGKTLIRHELRYLSRTTRNCRERVIFATIAMLVVNLFIKDKDHELVNAIH